MEKIIKREEKELATFVDEFFEKLGNSKSVSLKLNLFRGILSSMARRLLDLTGR